MVAMTLDPVLAVVIAEAPDGSEILIAARQSGIHRSTDRGRTWESRTSGFTVTLATVRDPQGVLRILAGTDLGMLSSDDLGISWEPRLDCRPSPLVSSVALVERDGEDTVLLAATLGDGIFRSTDYGVTWKTANLGLFVSSVTSLLPLGNQRAFAATDCCLFETRNAGTSWEEVSEIGPDRAIVAMTGRERIVLLGMAEGSVLVHDLHHRRALGCLDVAAHEEILGLWWDQELIAVTENAVHRIALAVGEDSVWEDDRSSVAHVAVATCCAFQGWGGVHRMLVGHGDGSVSTMKVK